MSWFQNPFHEEYRGAWVLGDRHHIVDFICPINAGRDGNLIYSWGASASGTYDLSGNDTDGTSKANLTIFFAADPEFRQWSKIIVDVRTSAASATAVTQHEISTALNNNNEFSGFFEAATNRSNNSLTIRGRQKSGRMKFYVVNGAAEESLKFNARAGVAELPTYFDRHKVSNLLTTAQWPLWKDNLNVLIPLNPVTYNVDAAAIDNAVNAKGISLGYSSGTIQEDWQLLAGRSGLFEFTISHSASETLVYPAGAKAGDLSKIILVSSGSTFALPHTLASGDLVTP